MKKKLPEPTPDIYTMLDLAGLTPGTLLATQEPMAKIVAAIRLSIAQQFKEYLDARETLLNKERKNGKV